MNISTASAPLNTPSTDLSNIQISGWLAVVIIMLVLAFFGFVAWVSLR